MSALKLIRVVGSDMYDYTWIKFKERKESIKLSSDDYTKLKRKYPLSKVQEKRIDDYYLTYFGKKISYDWHQFYFAHNGIFREDYYPELLYIPHFEHYMNYKKAYWEVLEDKNFLPNVAKAANVAMPKVVLSCTMNLLQNGEGDIVDINEAVKIIIRHERVFCKPTTTGYGGKGCFIYDLKHPNSLSPVELIRSLGSDFVIQELVICHESIATLFPKSVNTFRVTTYRWKGEMYHMPIAIRMGRGNLVVDNATSGGMFIGVYNDGSLCEEAMTISGERFQAHPDTEVVFKNHMLYGIPMVIDAAIKLHCLIPQLGVIGWDFTIGEDGTPILIEANVHKASYRLGMMAHGVSPFLERTPEVLQWVGKLSKLSASKRRYYLFGEIDR